MIVMDDRTSQRLQTLVAQRIALADELTASERKLADLLGRAIPELRDTVKLIRARIALRDAEIEELRATYARFTEGSE